MGLLVDTGRKTDQELTIAKDSHWIRLLKPGENAGQTLHCIAKRKGLGFIIGPTWAIITACSYYLLPVVVKNHETASSVAVLCSAIKLDVEIRAGNEPSLSRQVDGFTERLLCHLHVLQWRWFGPSGVFHAQLWRGNRLSSNN